MQLHLSNILVEVNLVFEIRTIAVFSNRSMLAFLGKYKFILDLKASVKEDFSALAEYVSSLVNTILVPP